MRLYRWAGAVSWYYLYRVLVKELAPSVGGAQARERSLYFSVFPVTLHLSTLPVMIPCLSRSRDRGARQGDKVLSTVSQNKTVPRSGPLVHGRYCVTAIREASTHTGKRNHCNTELKDYKLNLNLFNWEAQWMLYNSFGMKVKYETPRKHLRWPHIIGMRKGIIIGWVSTGSPAYTAYTRIILNKYLCGYYWLSTKIWFSSLL